MTYPCRLPYTFAVTMSHLPAPDQPRYCTRPFPAYRFLPGKNPHPRRDPRGHSYGLPEPEPHTISAENWQDSESFLYGVDLFNYGYWWECHEAFEAFWRAVGPQTQQGRLFQGLIQVAAANLKRVLGNHEAAEKLAQRALQRLEGVPRLYMGIDVERLMADVRESFEGGTHSLPVLRLARSDPRDDLSG